MSSDGLLIRSGITLIPDKAAPPSRAFTFKEILGESASKQKSTVIRKKAPSLKPQAVQKPILVQRHHKIAKNDCDLSEFQKHSKEIQPH
jgi:hypothetical protein